ncbi:hypothetical protein KM043_011526 [Ampulex compressa]|nr:hypothetical protein KM043_011526 [Ampulex compressa]
MLPNKLIKTPPPRPLLRAFPRQGRPALLPSSAPWDISAGGPRGGSPHRMYPPLAERGATVLAKIRIEHKFSTPVPADLSVAHSIPSTFIFFLPFPSVEARRLLKADCAYAAMPGRNVTTSALCTYRLPEEKRGVSQTTGAFNSLGWDLISRYSPRDSPWKAIVNLLVFGLGIGRVGVVEIG